MGGRRSPRAKGAEPRLPGRLEAEAVAVTLGALGAFVEIALLSYQPADPLFARGVRVENWCGPAGALVAGVLAGSLGWAAHVLPLAAAVIAFRYLRGLPLRPRWIPLAGWTLCLLSLSGGFEVLHQSFPEAVSLHAGGALGALVVAPLCHAFYLAGSSLVLAIALALGLMAGTGLSLRDGASAARRGSRSLSRELAQALRVGTVRFRRWLAARADARAEEAEARRAAEAEARAGAAAPEERSEAPRATPRVSPP